VGRDYGILPTIALIVNLALETQQKEKKKSQLTWRDWAKFRRIIPTNSHLASELKILWEARSTPTLDPPIFASIPQIGCGTTIAKKNLKFFLKFFFEIFFWNLFCWNVFAEIFFAEFFFEIFFAEIFFCWFFFMKSHSLAKKSASSYKYRKIKRKENHILV
jgi:hypothetical protein